MTNPLGRRKLLKGLLGGGAVAALTEMGLVSRQAEAQTVCRNANSICARGCKTLNCKNACSFAPFCEECVKCRNASSTPTPEPSDPCAFVNSTCSQIPTCGLSCGLACTGSTCAVCQTCFPED